MWLSYYCITAFQKCYFVITPSAWTRWHFDAKASMWMPLPAAITHWNVWLCCDIDFSTFKTLSVHLSPQLHQPKFGWCSWGEFRRTIVPSIVFIRYCANRTQAGMHAHTHGQHTHGQPKDIMPPTHLSVSGGKKWYCKTVKLLSRTTHFNLSLSEQWR